jgi:hypothetical protein
MRRVVVAALVAFAQTLARAQTCPCPPTPAPAAALAESTAVFEGTLTAITEGPYRANAEHILMGRWSVWRVTRAWKGTSAGATLRVFAPSDCAITWGVGARYLVYAHPLGVNPEPATSRCARTRPVEQASEDLVVLGPPASALARPPVDAGVPPASGSPPLTVPPAPRAAGGCAARR